MPDEMNEPIPAIISRKSENMIRYLMIVLANKRTQSKTIQYWHLVSRSNGSRSGSTYGSEIIGYGALIASIPIIRRGTEKMMRKTTRMHCECLQHIYRRYTVEHSHSIGKT